MLLSTKQYPVKLFIILSFFLTPLWLPLSLYSCKFSPKENVTFIAGQYNEFIWTGNCGKNDLCEFSFSDCYQDKPNWLSFTSSKGTGKLYGTPPLDSVGYKSCGGDKGWSIYYAQAIFDECWYFFNFNVVAPASSDVPQAQSLGVTQSETSDPQSKSGKSYTNTLTWKAPSLSNHSPRIVEYLIYQDKALTKQIGVVPNHGEASFEFKQTHVNRRKTHKYFIVVVNEESQTSFPSHIKMKRTVRKHQPRPCFF
ncbi:MAG: hypothetical protein ACH350_08085 [Parachlamydiaceae bacterium]